MGYNIGIFYKKKDAFGLDIGSHSLKLVQLKRIGSRRIGLAGYGSAEVPEGIVVEGIISDPESVAEAIKKIVREGKWGRITAQRVVASLPEAKIFTRLIELPEMDRKQMEEAVYWETEQYIPVPVADLYIDWQITRQIKSPTPSEDKKGRYEVLMVAAPKSIVDSYLQVLKLLDLEPLAFDISPAALTRALISPKTPAKTIIICDIGAVATDVAVTYNRLLRLTGSVPTGGDNITQAIASKLKIEKKEADELKRKFGLTKWSLQDKVVESAKPILDLIASEVQRIIRFYEERAEEPRESKPELVILSGGTATMPGLAEYLGSALGIPTEVGNPWANVSTYPLKPIAKSESTTYATAVGLALRGIEQ